AAALKVLAARSTAIVDASESARGRGQKSRHLRGARRAHGVCLLDPGLRERERLRDEEIAAPGRSRPARRDVDHARRGQMTKKALAVGVSGYGSPNDLPNCGRDAEAFGTALETIYRFDHVRVLKDDEATKEGVDRGLDWLFQGATANDRLVFFFSGPGCRIEKSGVIEEALVLPDGRLLDDHD